MSQKLITLQVRPARIVVLISNSGRIENFALAVRFLSQIWGGRSNLILPVSPDTVDDLTAFRLEQNRPDFVFGININHTTWESAVQRACQPRKYYPLTPEDTIDIRSTGLPKLIHSDKAIIASFERRTSPSAIVRPLKVVSVDHESKWFAYFAAVFGIHPPNLSEKYRDEAEIIDVNGVIDLIDTHRDFVSEWKESWLDAGSFGLSIHQKFSGPVDPTIVIVGDPVKDLSLFWNLRLASDTSTPSWILPIPESECNDELVLNSLAKWLVSFRNYGNVPNYCVVTSDSLDRERVKEIAQIFKPYLSSTEFKFVDYLPAKNRLPTVISIEHRTTWPAEFDRQRLTIVPPSPNTFSCNDRSGIWFTDIVKDNATGRAVGEIELPRSIVIPEVLNAPCPPSHEYGMFPRFGDGVDGINFYCDREKDTIRLQLPTAEEVLEEILREHGYEIKQDEKRNGYLPTIRRFGGLEMAATAMSGNAGEVLEILRSGSRRSMEQRTSFADDQQQSVLVGQGHALTPRQIKSRGKLGKGELGDSHFLNRVASSLKQDSPRTQRIGLERFRRYAHRRVPDEMTLQSLLEHWAEKSVINRKFELGPCPSCKRSTFVDRVNLQRLPKCDHCGSQLRMRESTGIAYSLDPSVRHSLSQGLPTVVLTGQFLKNMSNRGFFWLPGIKFQRDDTHGDMDLIACCDGRLIFGECKKLTNTPHDAPSWKRVVDQFLDLAKIAIECGGDLVVLAAMVNSYADEIQTRVEKELSGKIAFLLLSQSDLYNGRRWSSPERESPPICLHEIELKRYSEEPVERGPEPRQIQLRWGATFTKGIPSQPPSEDSKS